MVQSLPQCPSVGNQGPKFELPEDNLVPRVCKLDCFLTESSNATMSAASIWNYYRLFLEISNSGFC